MSTTDTFILIFPFSLPLINKTSLLKVDYFLCEMVRLLVSFTVFFKTADLHASFTGTRFIEAIAASFFTISCVPVLLWGLKNHIDE